MPTFTVATGLDGLAGLGFILPPSTPPPSNPTLPPSTTGQTSSPAVGPLYANLSGPLIRPIQQSGGSGPALTLPPGRLAYGIATPSNSASIVPASVMNVLQNPLYLAIGGVVVLLFLR